MTSTSDGPNSSKSKLDGRVAIPETGPIGKVGLDALNYNLYDLCASDASDEERLSFALCFALPDSEHANVTNQSKRSFGWWDYVEVGRKFGISWDFKNPDCEKNQLIKATVKGWKSRCFYFLQPHP